MYLCLRAQIEIEMLYGNKGVYVDSRSMKSVLRTYLLIVVSPLTTRETDRGKQKISCLSESTPAYRYSTED